MTPRKGHEKKKRKKKKKKKKEKKKKKKEADCTPGSLPGLRKFA